MKKNFTIALAITMMVGLAILVVGCSNPVTRDDSKIMSHGMEISTFISSEYFSRVDREGQFNFIKENYDSFLVDGVIDYRLMLNYMFSNIDRVIDIDLYEQII